MPEAEELTQDTTGTEAADAGGDDQIISSQDDGEGDGEGAHEPPEKPDWRVAKYGEDWQNSINYWKDNSEYAWREYKTEKQKRQKGIPLEEFNPAAAANGNGAAKVEAKQQTAPKPGEQKFESVDQLLEHINNQNQEFFQTEFEKKLSERERESTFRGAMQRRALRLPAIRKTESHLLRNWSKRF